MASKQLGKLRQWAGEKISSDKEKKSVATDEFKDLELEIERRRTGMEQIYDHSQGFYRYLMKKKETGEGEDKALPIEMLGRVMVNHGEEFGADSAYGHSLTALGNVHVSVASQQEEFADNFHTAFLTRLEASIAEVAQYYSLRKKLKSRRLAYDAAVSHAQKQFKKEKEKQDAEEEVTKARSRFEEMSEEVQDQMKKIQDGEMDQFKDLSRLLDIELKFAESWASALRDIKAEWPDDNEVYRVTPNRPKGPTHIMRPTTPAGRSVGDEAEVESDTSDAPRKPPPHKRSTSVPTTGSQSRKPSMSQWASATVGSFLRKEKSGEFAELNGDDTGNVDAQSSKSQTEAPVSLTRSRSGRTVPPPPRSRAQSTLSENHSSKHNSPHLPPRNLPPEKQSQKLMRALYSFTGGPDELSMEVGDEITVLSELPGGWWKGECKGVRGLFPANYTEEMPRKPPLPVRPLSLAKASHSQPSTPLQEFPAVRSRSNSANANRTLTADWKDEPFGDHHSALSPIAHSPDYRQTTHNRGDDEDDERGLVDKSGRSSGREDEGARNGVSSAHVGMVKQLSRSLSGKKAPPPPPPSRRTNSTSVNRPSSASNSATTTPYIAPKNPDNKNMKGAESKSPFDEGDPYGGTEDNDVASFSDFSISHKCRVCDCDDFQQSLFRNDGFCNSCFHSHTG